MRTFIGSPIGPEFNIPNLRKRNPNENDWLKQPKKYNVFSTLRSVLVLLICALYLIYKQNIQGLFFHKGPWIPNMVPGSIFNIACLFPLAMIIISSFFKISFVERRWVLRNELKKLILLLIFCSVPLFFVQNRNEFDLNSYTSYSISGDKQKTWNWKDATQIDIELSYYKYYDFDYNVTFPDNAVISISEYCNDYNNVWNFMLKLDDMFTAYRIPKNIEGLDEIPYLDGTEKVIGEIRIGMMYKHVEEIKHLLEIE